MRKIFLLFFLLFQFIFLSAQTSLNGIALENGPYSVGFKHYINADSSRSYIRTFDFSNQILPRPISISVWYPTEKQTQESQPLQVLDYLEILKEEEEWEYLPNEQILNWFEYRNSPSNRQHLTEKSTAFLDGDFGKEKFPIILYAPSFQATSIENFALFEFLASHGFVVFSSSSRGTESRSFSDNLPKEMETQARDLEFLLSEAFQFPLSDLDHMALMGFSFGGLASVITQNRNARMRIEQLGN